MNAIKTLSLLTTILLMQISSSSIAADKYIIDTKGSHAFIQFRVKHLGFSWLYGRFDKFEGEFTMDGDDFETAKITVTVDTTSLNSNHAERDKHLRNKKFLHVDKYPESKFISTAIKRTGENTMLVKGDLTLRGVTKAIEFPAEYIGGGKDPWGGYRKGFSGKLVFAMKDFGIPRDLGPASRDVELILDIEGIKH